MIQRMAWAGMALGLAMLPRVAEAFAPNGHDIIEAQAYRSLVEGTRTYDDGLGQQVTGQQVLEELLEAGVLKGARCFPVYRGSSGCIPDGDERKVLNWWPQPGTGHSDLVFARQFGPIGQCYHFLGQRDDEELGVTEGLEKNAYARCIRTLRALMNIVTTEASYEANLQNNGIYELMHALGDSYSSAHTERDPATNSVLWLRTWNKLPFVYSKDPKLRHSFIDDRDDRFRDTCDVAHTIDPACEPDSEHPYTFKYECLSQEGKAAVEALREVLLVVYRVRNRMQGPCKGNSVPLACAENQKDWEDFEERFLRRTNVARVPSSSQTVAQNELDEVPVLLLGATGNVGLSRSDYSGGVRLVGQLSNAPDFFLPFNPTLGLVLGWQRAEAGGTLPSLEADLTISLPFSEHFAFGVSPYRVTISDPAALDAKTLKVYFATPQLDFFFPQKLFLESRPWIRLTGPITYDVLSNREHWFLSLSVGVHFDRSMQIREQVEHSGLADYLQEAAQSEQGLLPLPGRPEIDPTRTWAPPSLDGKRFARDRRHRYVYVDFGANTDGGFIGDLNVLGDLGSVRAPWWLAVGGRLHVDLREASELGRTRIGLSPEVRLSPVKPLALVLDPAEFVWKPARGGQQNAFSLGARAGLALRWEVLQLTVRSPPLRYKSGSFDPSAGFDLGMGLNLAPVLGLD